MIIIHVSKLVLYITPWNLKMEQVSFRLNLVVLNCFNFFLNLYKSSLLMLAHYYGRLLLRHCFEQLRSTQVAVVHCSAQTTPMHVLQKLQQSCMVISSNTGRVYRPKDCERLVLYLKDLNLPKPDKWGTSQLIAFLQQVLLIDNLVLRQGGIQRTLPNLHANPCKTTSDDDWFRLQTAAPTGTPTVNITLRSTQHAHGKYWERVWVICISAFPPSSPASR